MDIKNYFEQKKNQSNKTLANLSLNSTFELANNFERIYKARLMLDIISYAEENVLKNNISENLLKFRERLINQIITKEQMNSSSVVSNACSVIEENLKKEILHVIQLYI